MGIEVGSSATHELQGLERLADDFPELGGSRFLVTPGTALVAARREPPSPGVLFLDLAPVAISRQMEREVTRRLGA